MESNSRKYKFYKTHHKPHKWEGKGKGLKGKCMLSSQFFNWDREVNLILTQQRNTIHLLLNLQVTPQWQRDAYERTQRTLQPLKAWEKKNQSSKVKTETRKHPGTAGKGTGMPSPPENVPGKKFSGSVFLQHWGSKPRALHLLGQCSTTRLHPSTPQ